MNTSYLLIPRIQIQNANAMSSAWTIGFPAMTAWMGAVHALERKLQNSALWSSIRLSDMAVSCHACDLQIYRGKGDFLNSISVTANPLRKKGTEFERPPFIEEARIHLTASLLIRIEEMPAGKEEIFCQDVVGCLNRMKIASGDLIAWDAPSVLYADGENEERKIISRLMPGYILVERKDLVRKYTKYGMDSLDAVLSLVSVCHHCESDDGGQRWNYSRLEPGWLVPIAVGFKGISPTGRSANQRDPSVFHRFAESVVTMGEFKMPYRISRISDLLWHYQYCPEKNLYICTNER